jgi:signal transduction histidine kinase
MRRRLLGTSLSLLTIVLLALTLPLAGVIAANNTQSVYIDRLSDTSRFAALAGPAIQSGQTVTLHAELRQYDGLFGVAAVVVDREGLVVASSRGPELVRDPAVQGPVRQALAGELAAPPRVVWPWERRDLVIAEPVSDGGEIVGAAVTVSPTGALRGHVAQRWALLAVAGLASLAGSWLLVLPVIRWVLRPVHDLDDATHSIAAGRLGARVASSTGPSELRGLARSFNAMADAVTAALAQQRSFVAAASHQLRNPLTALRLRLENLGPAVAPGDRDEHRLALDEADRLAGILDGLLALARAEGGRHEGEVGDVARAVAARLDAWRPVAQRRGIELGQTGPDSAPVRAAPAALDQMLDALLDNALKFGAERVSVDLVASDGIVELHVVDAGPGMKADELGRATERFWRGAPHQNVDGSGLGLSIVRALAEDAGGRLELRQATPRGLDAVVTLPAAVPGHGDGEQVPHAPDRQADAHERGGDDDGPQTASLVSR